MQLTFLVQHPTDGIRQVALCKKLKRHKYEYAFVKSLCIRLCGGAFIAVKGYTLHIGNCLFTNCTSGVVNLNAAALSAACQCIRPELLHTVGNVEILHSFAFSEGTLSDGFQILGKYNFGCAFAVTECTVTDCSHTVRNNDGLQSSAGGKRRITDGCQILGKHKLC